MGNTLVVSRGRLRGKSPNIPGLGAEPRTSSFIESVVSTFRSSPLSQTATIPPTSTPPLPPPTPPPSPLILRPPPNTSSPSSPSLSHPLPGNSKNSHLPPLVGGLVGGSVFLVLVSILVFLKCRRRRTGWSLDRARHGRWFTRGTLEVVNLWGRAGRIIWPGPEIFRHRNIIQDLLPNPISPITGGNHIPPESKRGKVPYHHVRVSCHIYLCALKGRLEHTRLELEEAQILRDAFQLNLDSRSSSNGLDDNSPDGGPDTAEFVAMRAQIQQMSVMIAALQAAVQQQAEDSQPPAYSTTMEP